MTAQVPAVIEAYFAADEGQETAAQTRCFAPDAEVRDEGHTYTGVPAIVAWKQAAKAKYQYTSQVIDAVPQGTDWRIRARVSGNFPGSPVELGYTFTVRDGLITLLRIGNA